MKPYRVLVADPPWLFSDKLPGKKRGAAKHYPCLPLADIVRFGLPPLADDCLLLLWRVSSMQREALHVAEAWGFEPYGECVWRKLTRGGKEHFGMGRILRAAHESCLLARRGRPVIRSRSVRSCFSAPVGRHSEKPEAFYRMIEQLSDGPYLELFARRQRPGWTCLGNEVPAP